MQELELPAYFTMPAVDYDVECLNDVGRALARRTPPGFSMIFDSTFRPADACNAFMADETTGTWGAGSPWRHRNRQKALADDLAQYMTWCHVSSRPWHQCTPSDLQDYANAMSRSVSFKTGRRLKRETRKRRVGTVVSFLNWGIARGYRKPLGSAEPGGVDTDGHRGPAGLPAVFLKTEKKRSQRPFRTSDVIVKGHEHDAKEPDVRPFTMVALRRTFDRLGPAVFEADGAPIRNARGVASRRNRLAAEVSYQTGMRVCEIVGIKAADISRKSAEIKNASPWQPFLLTVPTKGGGTRQVVVPAFVWTALLGYLRTERSHAMSKAREVAERAGQPWRDHGFLFVNGVDANDRDVGQAASTATLSSAFTRAVLAEGLTRRELRYILDPETGDPVRHADGSPKQQEVHCAGHTFHDLRHTFAVTTYRSEVERGNSEPWEFLRQRLGHKSVITTMDTYVRHVRLDEADLSDRHAARMRMDVYALR